MSFDDHSSQATLFWLSMTDVERDHIVERTLLTTRSIEFDAVLIAGGTAGLRDVKLSVLLQEAFRHCKALAAWGDGVQVLLDAGIDIAAPGVSSRTTAARP